MAEGLECKGKESVTAYRVGHLTLDYCIKDYVMIIVL